MLLATLNSCFAVDNEVGPELLFPFTKNCAATQNCPTLFCLNEVAIATINQEQKVLLQKIGATMVMALDLESKSLTRFLLWTNFRQFIVGLFSPNGNCKLYSLERCCWRTFNDFHTKCLTNGLQMFLTCVSSLQIPVCDFFKYKMYRFDDKHVTILHKWFDFVKSFKQCLQNKITLRMRTNQTAKLRWILIMTLRLNFSLELLFYLIVDKWSELNLKKITFIVAGKNL